MSRSQNHFAEFQPHTKHKHLILKHYFLAWGHKLGLRSGSGNSILYVDACAGRGADDIGNQGSPLIAAVAAATAEASVSRRRGQPFTIHVAAVESNRKFAKTLSNLLTPFGRRVRVLEGVLSDHLDALEQKFAHVPTLYFIDPFGLEALEAAVVRRALRGPRQEALLLFADQAALRHFGAISARETRAERRLRNALSPLPLFPSLASADADRLAAAAAESRLQLDITRDRAIRIMNSAFGDDLWLAQLEGVPKRDRRRAFLSLYQERLRAWGASHVLPIPVVDAMGTPAYTLIHASKSSKAFAAMKEAVTYAFNHSPLPDEVVRRMRDLVRCDLLDVETGVRQRFAGQQIRWAEDPEDPRASCVRNYLLEETPVFPFELNDLRARFASARLPGKVMRYAFPKG